LAGPEQGKGPYGQEIGTVLPCPFPLYLESTGQASTMRIEAMRRPLLLVITATVAALIAPYARADAYIALSKAAVLATVSPDLLGTTKLDPRPFAQCFRAQGLTKKDLKAAIQSGAESRIIHCLDKLIGL
jgi:hypothetical protein